MFTMQLWLILKCWR